jgi:hypothetical protein
MDQPTQQEKPHDGREDKHEDCLEESALKKLAETRNEEAA